MFAAEVRYRAASDAASYCRSGKPSSLPVISPVGQMLIAASCGGF